MTSTTVRIPPSVTPLGSLHGYGEIPYAATNTEPGYALRAGQANCALKGITPDQRQAFTDLAAHQEVDVAILTDAIVAATAAAATRLGQSMARRYQRDLLVATWAWLKAGAPVPAEPVSYTTGAPVTVTLHPDGRVTLSVDTSEIADGTAAEHAAWCLSGEHAPTEDEYARADEIVQAVQTALDKGTVQVLP